ncbi:MAG TPA: hypothetical protein VJ873_05255 [bacterium]|nr:hypothetical protein [bacterium]
MEWDTNAGRFFGIPIDITTPSSTAGRNCTSQCYNNFQVNLRSGQNTAWMPLTFTWSQFAEGYNQLALPQNSFSNHLTRALQLEWSFSPNASIVTTTTTDFGSITSNSCRDLEEPWEILKVPF